MNNIWLSVILTVRWPLADSMPVYSTTTDVSIGGKSSSKRMDVETSTTTSYSAADKQLHSPRDWGSSNGGYESAKSKNAATEPSVKHILADSHKLTSCQRECSKRLGDAVGIIFKSMSHVDRYNSICRNYNESFACIEHQNGCKDEDHTLFHVMTSGIKYMCVDQKSAFHATIKCVDLYSPYVQNECENSCNTKGLITDWIMKSSLLNFVQVGSMVPKSSVIVPTTSPTIFEPSAFDQLRDMSSSVCKMGDCVLDCLRTKFNSKCEGKPGTLLSEALVRPIATTQEHLGILNTVFSMMAPEECSFLLNGFQLEKHRIDPLMDAELREMYASNETSNEVAEIYSIEGSSSYSNNSSDDVGLSAVLSEVTSPISPFDIDETYYNTLDLPSSITSEDDAPPLPTNEDMNIRENLPRELIPRSFARARSMKYIVGKVNGSQKLLMQFPRNG